MSSAPPPENPDLLARAHVVPFVVFMAFMILLLVVGTFIEWKHPEAPWWRQDPAQWIYPIQSIVTLGFLYHYRNAFRFDWSLKWSAVAIGFGAIGIAFWLLPSIVFDLLEYQENPGGLLEKLGVKQRDDGFNPGIFQSPAAYWASLILRFFRAVVIVALVEEIFWRGFFDAVCDGLGGRLLEAAIRSGTLEILLSCNGDVRACPCSRRLCWCVDLWESNLSAVCME